MAAAITLQRIESLAQTVIEVNPNHQQWHLLPRLESNCTSPGVRVMALSISTTRGRHAEADAMTLECSRRKK